MITFCVFPALGYWEIDGKPVSSKEAEYGLNPRAIWKPTEIARSLELDLCSGFECGCCGARGLEPCEGDCVGGERRQEFDAE